MIDKAPKPRSKKLPPLAERVAPGPRDYALGAREAIFPAEFVERLAERHKIDAERVPELQSLLEGWADIYLATSARIDEKPRAKKIKAELSLVRDHVRKLQRTLQSLHPETANQLWFHEPHIGPPPFSEAGVFESPFGHSIHKIAVGPNKWAVFRLEEASHFESLSILQAYAASALKRVNLDRGGRRHSDALALWVHNVRAYWRENLRRPFSAKTGVRFCIEAFGPLDPHYRNGRRLETTIAQILRRDPTRKNVRTAKK